MAQTLKFGNKTWATKVGSTLAYNDENGNYKPLPFAFTRSTSATRVNKEGLIEVVTNDRPRIDYTDTSDGVLLLEKAATNLITYSSDFSNSNWSNSRIETPYIADTISPDGTLNAYTLEMSSGETNGGGVYKTGISISGGNSFSVFAKKKTANYLVLSDTGTTSNAVYFDLENGVVGTKYNATGEIQDFGNGWYRCTMKYTLTSSGLKFIYLSNVDGATTGGVQSGDSIYVFGAMLEQNSVASSYIPTQGSATTRVAETASGSGNSEVFNDSEGVLFADILPSTFTDVAPNYYKTITVSDNTTSNRVFVGVTSTSKLSVGLSIGGTNSFFPETLLAKINVKVALKYTTNSITVYLNGFKPQTPISGSFNFASGALKSLNLNDASGSYPFYGSTKEIGYYNTILTDLELETLTSYKSWTSMVNELNLNIIYNG